MQTTRTPYSISFMATVLLLLLFACHSTVANADCRTGCDAGNLSGKPETGFIACHE